MTPPLLSTFHREVTEVCLVVGKAFGKWEVREQRLTELDLDVRSLGNPQAVIARGRDLLEEVTHLGSRLQVVLGSGKLEPLRIRQQCTGLHTEQRVVALVILLMRVMTVVRCQ